MFWTLMWVFAVLLGLMKLMDISELWRYVAFLEKAVYFGKFLFGYAILAVVRAKHRFEKSRNRSADKLSMHMLPSESDWKQETPVADITKDQLRDGIEFTGLDKTGGFLHVSLIRQRHGVQLSLFLRQNGILYKLADSLTMLGETCENDKRVFSATGFRFEIHEPCRRWRVWINTAVRKYDLDNSTATGSPIHLKINGWWRSNSDIFDFNSEFDSAFVARQLARNHWSRSLFRALCKHNTIDTSHWGHLIAELKIDSIDCGEVSFHCLKSRRMETVRPNTTETTRIALFKDGTYLVTRIAEITGFNKFASGYLCKPSGDISSISDTTLIYEDEHVDETHQFYSRFNADGSNYILRGSRETVIPKTVDEIGVQIDHVDLHGVQGWAFSIASDNRLITENSSRDLPAKLPDENISRLTKQEKTELVLPLCHRAAIHSDLTGGKGCNLAKLFLLQGQFTVPVGLCVTTNSYNLVINRHHELKRLVEKLDFYGKLSDTELRSTCNEILRILSDIGLPSELITAIEYELDRSFNGHDWRSKKFAVRSSAVGEDSADLSTAGQLETFLELEGLDSILNAVRLCWASQFKEPAVQYRKQHGQLLTNPVAVVVQLMVEPDVAGVLFTNDPVSGSPLKMIINANPGIGEFVVSGSVTPDTIVLQRDIDSDSVSIDQVIPCNIGSDCCLSTNLALKLGEIGLYVERAYAGKPKDIEWAIKGGKIFLLQARDITSLETENQFDLMHEFDSAIRNEDDCFTTANVGEVLSKPQTPLAMQTSVRSLDLSLQGSNVERKCSDFVCSYKNDFVYINNNRVLMKLDSLYKDTAYMEDTRLPEFLIMGHALDEPEIKQTCLKRYGIPPLYMRIYRLFEVAKVAFIDAPRAQKPNTIKYGDYTFPEQLYDEPKSLYDALTKRIIDLADIWKFHIDNSIASTFSYSFVAGIVLPQKGEWTAENFADVALLMSNCENVISADVPAALKEIARSIVKSGYASSFRSQKPEEAIQWLNCAESQESGQLFRQFLRKHGHRSIGEIDIGATSWRTDPIPLIVTLQNMISDPASLQKDNETLTIDEAISKCSAPMDFIKKKVLRFFVSVARTNVGRREHSKNLGIRMTDQFRNGYRKLGRLLHEQGLLPEDQLIFYLTHFEIGELINTRPAKLVAKAVRRRKLMQTLQTFRYPEIIIGVPKPIDSTNLKLDSSVLIKGTPVSRGCVEGPVRVAITLEDATNTQPGEILIATSTDIGWSPYFPMLSGVVTELGGLLSHGAVVAREYGLPCIVNAKNATHVFTTGDFARLDATTGTLQKIEKN